MSQNKKKYSDYELEVWKRLWQSRDFELSHFWQRSVFLTAFIVLGFTTYGVFQGFAWDKLLNDELLNNNKITNFNQLFYLLQDNPLFIPYNMISIFLCFIVLVLSILWIMMAKGSKNVYEVQECALKKTKNKILKKAYVELKNNCKKTNSCICSSKGYRYSVSRINVFLGIFSVIIFTFLTLIHLILLLQNCIFILFIFMVFIVLYYLIYCLKGSDK